MPNKAQYASRRANGKCAQNGCDEDAVEGRVQCQLHLDENARRNKERRARLKEAGLCQTCGQRPPVEGLIRCQPCHDHAQARDRRVVAERKRKGICLRCQKKAIRNHIFCRKCLNKSSAEARARERKNRLARYLNGKCVKCGKRPPKNLNVVYCSICLAQASAYQSMRREIKQYERANGKSNQARSAVQDAKDVHDAPGRYLGPAITGRE